MDRIAPLPSTSHENWASTTMSEHAVMNFEVRALNEADFDKYIELRKEINSKTGKPYTTAEALAQVNCGELCAPLATTTTPFNTDRTAREASGAGQK